MSIAHIPAERNSNHYLIDFHVSNKTYKQQSYFFELFNFFLKAIGNFNIKYCVFDIHSTDLKIFYIFFSCLKNGFLKETHLLVH